MRNENQPLRVLPARGTLSLTVAEHAGIEATQRKDGIYHAPVGPLCARFMRAGKAYGTVMRLR